MHEQRMTVADRLAELHFTSQAGLPTDLENVGIVQLDPLLRGLLFAEGMVTRVLEAHTLCPVVVEVLEQTDASPPAAAASYLAATPRDACIRRRVLMRITGARLSVSAESYFIPDRLPADFLELLERSSHGIGGSLQQLELESRHELLWFGLARPPQRSGSVAPRASALTRCYRVIVRGLPALLIRESFAVEMRSGRYRLAGSAGADMDRLAGAAQGELPDATLTADRTGSEEAGEAAVN